MTSSIPIPAERPADAPSRALHVEGNPPDIVETAELLASELVNNVIVHGSGEAALVLEVENNRIHIEVLDADPTLQSSNRCESTPPACADEDLPSLTLGLFMGRRTSS